MDHIGLWFWDPDLDPKVGQPSEIFAAARRGFASILSARNKTVSATCCNVAVLKQYKVITELRGQSNLFRHLRVLLMPNSLKLTFSILS